LTNSSSSEDARLSPAERDAAVDGLIALVGAVDGILQAQAKAGSRYFFDIAGRRSTAPSASRSAQPF
jgi:hypothetical protein